MSRKKRPADYHDRERARQARGDGGIYQRADGLWCSQVSLGYDAKGKRVRITVYGNTRAEARVKRDQLKRDHADGKVVQPSRLTVKEHFEDWLRTKKPPNTKPGTYNKYAIHVEKDIIPRLGTLQLKKLNYRHINRFYESLDERGLSPRTVYDVASILRMGLNDAVTKGLIADSPAKLATKRPKGRKRARFMTPDEIEAFFAGAQNERLLDAYRLGIETGLRPGELLGLRWTDVDLETRVLHVRESMHEEGGEHYIGELKTPASTRTITLSDEAIDTIRSQRVRQEIERANAKDKWRHENLLFTNLSGGLLRRTHIMQRDFRRVLRRAALVQMAKRCEINPLRVLAMYKEAGERRISAGEEIRLGDEDGRTYVLEQVDLLEGVTLHTFRHTHVAILLAMGIDIQTISERLGHEDASITMQIYSHMMPGRDKEAAAAMDRFAQSRNDRQ